MHRCQRIPSHLYAFPEQYGADECGMYTGELITKFIDRFSENFGPHSVAQQGFGEQLEWVEAPRAL
jgi:hypothetical protein